MDSSKWEKLHSNKRHQPKYPAESCIRFIKGNFPQGARVLDDGCGAGRHTLFLAEEGYIPYALDYSLGGVECTKERLGEKGFKKFASNVYQSSCADIPFKDEFFDGCICYGVLYYMNKEDITRSIKEIYRTLKKEGMCMLHIRSIEDYRFDATQAIKEDAHGLIIKEGNNEKSTSAENGMFMHFFDRKEVEELLKDFSLVTIDSEKRYHDNDSYCDANFIVVCKK